MSKRYIVQPGDYLTMIARDNGLRSWQQIDWHPDNKKLRAKRAHPDRIFAGDEIMIPDAPAGGGTGAAGTGGSGRAPTFGPPTPNVSGLGDPETVGPLDVGGLAVGAATTILDFMEIFGALEAAGGGAALVSPILNSIATIMALLAAWAAADALARFNGKCQGFWEAMQDMADAFGDGSLDAKPLSEWPAIPVPQPHFGNTPEAQLRAEELQWRSGQQEGAMQALQVVQQMEANPREFPANLGGQPTTVRLSGKQWLRALKKSKSISGEISSFIHAEIDKKLKEQGHPEWPVWK
jgi:hypothetical protein